MVAAAQHVRPAGDVEPAPADLEESTAFLIGHEREVFVSGVWSWLQWRNLGLVTLLCLATTSVTVAFSGMTRSGERRAPLRGVQAQSLMGTPWSQSAVATYCHTSQPGELCHSKVEWALEVGIPHHPDIYNFNLNSQSTPTEIQAWLHRSGDASGCPMPCPVDEVTTTATTTSSTFTASSWGVAVHAACNPTTCPTGLMCKSSSDCCEEYDWDCCGAGTGKYANRKYCPSQSRYHIMCGTGECADSDEACEGKGGVKYGAPVCSRDDGFLGCYKQVAGFGIVQPSPQWCDSADKCRCPAEFRFVAFFNGNVTGHRNKAQWSCLRTMPEKKSTSCVPYGSWHVGTNGPNAAIYHNPDYKSVQTTAMVMTSDSAGTSTRQNIPCHTAVRDEHCFDLVLWAIREGIHEHPDWFHAGLSERSTFEEVQAALAQSESSGCPKPCAPSADVGTSTFGTTGAGNFKMGGPGCHTAKEGEECYNFVQWSMAAGLGITRHPSFNTSGLSSQSTFEEFQSVLHRDAGTRCPVPCAPGESERAELFREAVAEVRRDREERERQEQEDAVVAHADEEQTCGLIEVGKDYPGNDLYAVAEVESAGHCCTLCSKDDDCVAWSWRTDHTKPDGQVCYLKGASPRPTLSRVNDSTFTSGQPMKGGKMMPVLWPSRGLSMYCISTVSPQGYDHDLILFQYKLGTGIFACDQYDVFSNVSFAVAPAFFTRAVRGNMTVRAGELLPGMDMVTGVWELIGKDKQYQRFDWTVKVAPDAIFLARRLQTKLLMHAELPQGSYLNNCAEGLKDAIMVFSRGAVARLSRGIADCVEYAGELQEALWWREARFLDVCLEKVLGVYRDNDWSLMYSEGCTSPAGWSNCKDGLVPAFHPFRAEGGYRQCLLNAEMSR